MADKVFVHIGLPKTATTYLQTVMWGARDTMRADGVLLPGAERRDHLWASRTVRLDGAPVNERAGTAWQRLLSEIAEWPGTAVISHEFFAAASAEQAAGVVEALAPAEVHVVTTAREPLGLFAASWQEALKNRSTSTMADYGRDESADPKDIWNWRTLDLRLVLNRWAPTVSPDRVHVLPLPDKDAPREQIWHNFAGLIGLDSSNYDLSQNFPNESMGVVEAETLRRVNAHLTDFTKAFDRGVYIRTFLGDERLVPRRGERFWPDPDQIEDCRRRGRLARDMVVEHGFDVIGDVDRLLVPDVLPPRRNPADVTDAEVAEVAVELVATMLGDIRELRRENARLREVPRGSPIWAAAHRLRAALPQSAKDRLRRAGQSFRSPGP